MTFEELTPILRKVFTGDIPLDVGMKKNDILSWDSIGHLNLILEVEEDLAISFTKEEIETIDSFNSLLNIINSKLK